MDLFGPADTSVFVFLSILIIIMH